MAGSGNTIKRRLFQVRPLIAFVITSLLPAEVAFALDRAKSITQYVHQVWQAEEGLPQNSVVGIAQTKDGYVWLATQEGLVRFDGVRFFVFNKQNTPQITENNIQAVCADRMGGLWAGTEGGGLVYYKDGKFSEYTTSDGLSDSIVDAVFEDSAGTIWVGTPNGLDVLQNGRFANVPEFQSLPHHGVLSIYQDQDLSLWIGADGGGLVQLKDHQVKSYTTKDGLINDSVRSICRDEMGNLWLGTRGGLSRLGNGRFENYDHSRGLPNDSVLSTYVDGGGSLWIGTDGGGLTRINQGKAESYTKKQGLSDDSVAAIFEDAEGVLWIGTYEGGLNALKDGKFLTFTTEEGLTGDMVRAVFQDSKGTIWVGTRDGLTLLKGGAISVMTSANGLPNNSVLSFCEDATGAVWIGTRGGLSRFYDGKIKNYGVKDGLADDAVLALCAAGDSLWIGSSGGLTRLKDAKFTTYTAKDGLTDNAVWSIRQGMDGSLWIGTDGGGVDVFKDERFLALTTKTGLPNDIVMTTYEDADSTMWIATGGGLVRIKDGKFTVYDARAGLFDDLVFQIIEDRSERLWMSCNRGIFYVSKKDLEDFADGRSHAVNAVAYGTSDGLKTRECNGGTQPAGWRARDGRIWFATIKGAVVIDPDKIKTNERPPPVVIEEVTADGKPLGLAGNISVPSGRGKLEFHYAGLSYFAPEKVRFRYKLEGFDRDWIDAGNKRETSYTNIPPGGYRFLVTACNNDGVWSAIGASLAFYVEPQYYQTYWFYGLCLLFAALIAWSFYVLRVNQMKSRFSAVLAERNRIARDLHDTLEQGFAGVGLHLEAAAATFHAPDLARRHLDTARDLVRQSRTEARLSIWNLRSRVLERGDMVSAISEVAGQLTAGTSFKLEVRSAGEQGAISRVIEETLLRVAQEAVTNAVKHSHASEILIDLRFERRIASILVKDNGSGFDASLAYATAGSMGLLGMRERVEQIGGHLTIVSRPGEGTELLAELPIS